MANYRNNSSGAVKTQQEVLKEFPNISFGYPLTADTFTGLGYTVIESTAQPSYTQPYESVRGDGIEEKDGKWYEKWKVVTANDTEKGQIDKEKADRSRADRDKLLAETDWRASSDLTLSDDWKTYRQALRDIPKASGWPHTHTWPTEPS